MARRVNSYLVSKKTLHWIVRLHTHIRKTLFHTTTILDNLRSRIIYIYLIFCENCNLTEQN